MRLLAHSIRDRVLIAAAVAMALLLLFFSLKYGRSFSLPGRPFGGRRPQRVRLVPFRETLSRFLSSIGRAICPRFVSPMKRGMN